MESSTRLFICVRDFHLHLVGGKVLWFRSDLIRLTKERVCGLNGERSIVDVAQTRGIRPIDAVGNSAPFRRQFDRSMRCRKSIGVAG